jgi:tetratricopeptide (TPR) repeat protein
MMLRRFRQAQDFLSRGAARQALRLFEQDLGDGGARWWSGIALSELGRFEQARRRLEDAPPLFRARLLYDAGQTEEARRVLETCPDNLQAATLLAACAVRLKQAAAAEPLLAHPLPHAPWALARLLAAIEERTPLPPESPAPLDALPRSGGGVRRGLVHLRAERWLPALAAFGNSPAGDMSSYGQAVALYYLQHLDRAADLLNPILGRLQEPFAADGLAILGKVDLERNRTAEGVLRLRRAIARGAAAPENYYALGVGLLRQGARRPAIRALERCVSVEFVRRRFGDLRAIADM